MNKIAQAAAILLAVIFSATAVTPSYAIKFFNHDTLEFEERATGPGSGRRSYKAIPRQIVPYETSFKPGTIIVETSERRLYFVLPDGEAIRYGIGVGRDGF